MEKRRRDVCVWGGGYRTTICRRETICIELKKCSFMSRKKVGLSLEFSMTSSRSRQGDGVDLSRDTVARLQGVQAGPGGHAGLGCFLRFQLVETFSEDVPDTSSAACEPHAQNHCRLAENLVPS